MDAQNKLVSSVAYIQICFYIVAGIWPVLDISSFIYVTGPKTDFWLVKTVGLLILATGIVMLTALRRREFNCSIILLAFLNAIFLTGIDVYYVLTDVISNIYLLDAFLETALWLFWGAIFIMKMRDSKAS